MKYRNLSGQAMRSIAVVLALVFAVGMTGCDNGTTSGGGDNSTPSKPQNLKATADDDSVTLSWSTPAKNGGAEIIYYQVQRSGAGGGDWIICDLTTYTFNGLNSNTPYIFKVCAVNDDGKTGAVASITKSTTSAQGSGAELTLTLMKGEKDNEVIVVCMPPMISFVTSNGLAPDYFIGPLVGNPFIETQTGGTDTAGIGCIHGGWSTDGTIYTYTFKSVYTGETWLGTVKLDEVNQDHLSMIPGIKSITIDRTYEPVSIFVDVDDSY